MPDAPAEMGALPALPEPDFLMDGGRLRCYYVGTVQSALSQALADRQNLIDDRDSWIEQCSSRVDYALAALAERDEALAQVAQLQREVARLSNRMSSMENIPAEDFVRKIARQMGPPPFKEWPVSHVCQQNADEASELVDAYNALGASGAAQEGKTE